MAYRSRRRSGTYGPYGYGARAAATPTPTPPPDPLPEIRKQVENIYKDYAKLVVADAQKRSEVLTQALAPLDKAVRIATVRRKLPPDGNRLWNLAAKCRAQALGTPYPEERETAIRMAVDKIDRIVASLQIPTFAAAQTALENNIAAYAAKIAAREAAKLAARAARAAARKSAPMIPVIGPTVVVPPVAPTMVIEPAVVPPQAVPFVPPAAGPINSPYTTGSCRDVIFRMLVAGWYTIPEVLAAAAGTAKDPKGVFSANFFPRRKPDSNNRVRWEVLRDADKFHITILP